MPIDESGAQRLILARVARRLAPQVVGPLVSPSDDRQLAQALIDRDPGLSRWLALTRWSSGLAGTLILLAGLLGVLTDALAHAGRIDLLAAPWLGVLAWNLGVIAIGLLMPLMRGRVGARRMSSFADACVGRAAWLTRLADRLAHWRAPTHPGGESDWRARFAQEWLRQAWPLNRLRASATLHRAAAVFTMGLLMGLYWRGLLAQYRAGWDSTFLDPSQVHALLGVLLAPSGLIGALAMPDVATIARLRWSTGTGEPAGVWIHRFAITLGVLVILPRLLLAWRDARRARRLADDFPLVDDPPSDAASVPEHGLLLPCGWQPTPARLAGLQALAQAESAAGSTIAIAPPMAAEGIDHPQSLSALPGVRRIIVVFNLSATPEAQTHGEFLREMRRRADPQARLQAWVDECSFIARFAAQPARLAERREAWQRLGDETGVAMRFVREPGKP